MVKAITIVGEKLAQLRRESFYSQEELAQKLGMAKSNVSRWEQSETSGVYLKNFRTLAEIFKLSPQDLEKRIGVNGDAQSPAAVIANLPHSLRQVTTTGDQVEARQLKSAAKRGVDASRIVESKKRKRGQK